MNVRNLELELATVKERLSGADEKTSSFLADNVKTSQTLQDTREELGNCRLDLSNQAKENAEANLKATSLQERVQKLHEERDSEKITSALADKRAAHAEANSDDLKNRLQVSELKRQEDERKMDALLNRNTELQESLQDAHRKLSQPNQS